MLNTNNNIVINTNIGINADANNGININAINNNVININVYTNIQFNFLGSSNEQKIKHYTEESVIFQINIGKVSFFAKVKDNTCQFAINNVYDDFDTIVDIDLNILNNQYNNDLSNYLLDKLIPKINNYIKSINNDITLQNFCALLQSS